jgi:hypothetical protein
MARDKKLAISPVRAAALGFRLKVENQGPYQPTVKWSHDGGRNWRGTTLYNDIEEVKRQLLNNFYVDKVLKPDLKEGESLCFHCRNNADVGIMRFSHYTTGREVVATEVYGGGEDEPTVQDVSYGCRYAITKCSRCNFQESDYG